MSGFYHLRPSPMRDQKICGNASDPIADFSAHAILSLRCARTHSLAQAGPKIRLPVRPEAKV